MGSPVVEQVGQGDNKIQAKSRKKKTSQVKKKTVRGSGTSTALFAKMVETYYAAKDANKSRMSDVSSSKRNPLEIGTAQIA